MKIVFTGGHHNCALVIAKEFIKKSDQIYWLGHKYSMVGDKNTSAEYKEVTNQNISFFDIKAGKWQPKSNFLVYLLRIPFGFWQTLILLNKLKPDLVFSFGGYLGFTVAVCAYLLKIPVVIHEQTVAYGESNKVVSRIAKRIFVSFPTSQEYFPKEKTIYTGLPLRPEIFYKGNKNLFKNDKRTIFIAGGKQGSHLINKAFFEIAGGVIKSFNVIHQCGFSTIYNDFQKGLDLKFGLGEYSENYLVKEYFYTPEIGKIYKNADFLICRSGAHTIYEIIALQKPCILIPISWSSQNEQEKNALLVKDLGLAKILKQEELTGERLLAEITDFNNNLDSYKLSKEFCLIDNPQKIIVSEIYKLLAG